MKSKHTLISELRSVFREWESFLSKKTEKELVAKRGDKWSIKDEVAHLMAWQQISIARLKAAAGNQDQPDLPSWLGGADPAYAEEHTKEFNAGIQSMYRHDSWISVYQLWKEGFEKFLQLAEEIPDPMLFDALRFPWLRGYPLSAVLQGSLEHHRDHLAATAAMPQTR